MTRLKDQRRRDKIEHDMRNFGVTSREYPRFSDNPEVPFWLADQPQHAMGATAPPVAFSRAVSEPVLKVTDVPWGHASQEPTQEKSHMMHAAGRAASGADRIGSKTVKRWTSESIERGEGHNKPRLFDSIQPVRIGPKDLESLDITSSMEPIRNAATAKMRGEGMGAPKRSHLWMDPSATQHPGHAAQEEAATAQRSLHTSNIIQSEPSLRVAVQREDIAHEPRFFGSTTHIARPAAQTAVRSGGFQRVTANTGQMAQSKSAGRSKGEHRSKGDSVPQ